MEIQVLLITVNYKQCAITRRFIDSVKQIYDNEDLYTIIVDNETCSKSAFDDYRKSNTSILPLEENKYYFGAANAALQFFRDKFEYIPKWVILSNNDILIKQCAFFETLKAIDDRRYQVIAPSIISTLTNWDQNPGIEKPYTLFHLFYWKLFYFNYYLARIIYMRRTILNFLKVIGSRRTSIPEHNRSEREIYAPYGAFMIFSRQYFMKGGAFDNNFDLFNEELIVAQTARKNNMRVYYYPLLQVYHDEHYTTGGGFTKKKYRMSRESYRYIYDKYFKG